MELLRESFDAGRKFSLQVHADLDLAPLWDYAPFEELVASKR